ncbi:ATP-grasp domain-containing protein [Evansella cellulosilytica]|uniref:RimK domain protein ATP-grasp n=1 Tax=Evansella cellulosilytica (strain ATCC 21833 / DSM 2522 / FERM P-1141 / JCM 9156 / N-4) TaxID=649639 RepID=E6TZP7_EVAC2|nr:RimK domain-containing protein ATP-grasp [Evansella cellulosilytica]ADU31353.1 RimK domain protein ATP-grasp [Evansella cellulosilytica DSM 2522]
MVDKRLGWLIYRNEDIHKNERFINFLHEAAEQYDLVLSLVSYEDLVYQLANGTTSFTDKEKPSFVINRSVSPWLNEVIALNGIRVFNNATVARLANDKRLTHAYFQHKGIRMLPTVSTTKLQLVKQPPLSFPFVVKDPLSRGGVGVFHVKTEKELVELAPSFSDDCIVQPVCDSPGKDLRVYIMNNEIVAAILRESETSTEIRANISTGGTSRLYDLSHREKMLITKMCEEITIDFAGIDFLFDKNGDLLFNEMEDAVGCRSLYMNSEINIAALFMKHVKETLLS